MNRIADSTNGGGLPDDKSKEAGNIPPSVPPAHEAAKPKRHTVPVKFGAGAVKGHYHKSASPEIMERVREAVMKGHTRRDVCRLAGISPEIFYRWLHENPDFKTLVERAESELAGRLLAIIDKASHMQWPAAAWILERRFPEQWGRHLVTELPKAQAEDAKALSEDEQIKRLRGVFGMAAGGPNKN